MLYGRGHAGNESTPAYRDQDGAGVREVLENFQANGAGPSDDACVVVRGNRRQAALGAQRFGFSGAVFAGGANDDDVGAERAGHLQLELRGVIRHDHHSGNAELLGGVRDRLGVVAARMRHHTERALIRGERQQGIEGPAQFERAGGLKAFGFQPEIFQGKRHQGCADHMGANARVSGADGVKRDQGGGAVGVGIGTSVAGEENDRSDNWLWTLFP